MALHRAFPAPSISRLIAALIVLVFTSAQGLATTLLRDADIEHGLKQLASPVLKAAGLSPNRVKILIVDAGSLNAFVVSNDAIFIHYGLIAKFTSARQLQGVIAHEAAHIANGHLTRRFTNLGAARTAAGLGIALAAIAVAAGGGEAAAGVALGAQSSAQRLFLKHTRSEESSADQSAARYLRSAGIDPQGLVDVFSIFRGQEVLAERRQDPYVRSHPFSRDRMRAIAAAVSASSKTYAPRPNDDYWFARVKGKLTGYKRGPKWTLGRAGDSGYGDVKAIRQAAAYLRQSQIKKSLRAIDSAIAARPTDPFLHDMRGEILMKSRNFPAAASAYGRAVKLAPRDPLILAGYGRALIAAGQPKTALPFLEKARSIDYRDGIMLRDLAQAYAKTGQRGMASLVTSEHYALRGDLKTAGIHAKRASDLLSRGSGPWQRAQDVLIASERFAKRKKR